MTSEIARMVVRSFMEQPALPLSGDAQLSSREEEILALLAEGLSNKEIGSRLHISFGTVRTHWPGACRQTRGRGKSHVSVETGGAN